MGPISHRNTVRKAGSWTNKSVPAKEFTLRRRENNRRPRSPPLLQAPIGNLRLPGSTYLPLLPQGGEAEPKTPEEGQRRGIGARRRSGQERLVERWRTAGTISTRSRKPLSLPPLPEPSRITRSRCGLASSGGGVP